MSESDLTEYEHLKALAKASEKRIQMIIENMPVGLIIINPAEGVVESVNPRFETISGQSAIALRLQEQAPNS